MADEPAAIKAWNPATHAQANYRPTPELRWYQSKSGRSATLQQLWVSDDSTDHVWRAVPTVVNGVTLQKGAA